MFESEGSYRVWIALWCKGWPTLLSENKENNTTFNMMMEVELLID